MPKKKIIPVWRIIYSDFPSNRIECENIFDCTGFKKDCDSAYKKNKDNFDGFATEVKRSLFYYFNSKCEWEICICSLFDAEGLESEKVDVYDQVMLNWDVFIKYVWDCYRGVWL